MPGEVKHGFWGGASIYIYIYTVHENLGIVKRASKIHPLNPLQTTAVPHLRVSSLGPWITSGSNISVILDSFNNEYLRSPRKI